MGLHGGGGFAILLSVQVAQHDCPLGVILERSWGHDGCVMNGELRREGRLND